MITAKIQPHKGVPTLFLNGKPHSAFAYMSYNLQEQYIRSFADAGIDIFSFSVSPDYDYYKFSNDGSIAPGQDSYDDFDTRMQMILTACPNAKVFPRLYMCSPAWWDKEHPDELMAGINGVYNPVPEFGWLPENEQESARNLTKMTVPSFSSKAWLDYSSNALQKFLRYSEGKYGNNIIGYHITSGGTQEWYYWGAFEDLFPDTSKPQQEAFRNWLNERGMPCTDPAPIPSAAVRKGSELGMFRDPSTDSGKLASEYWQFHAWAIANAMGRFCKVTRDQVGPDKFIGVFYGYFVDLQRQTTCWHNSGHLAFRQMSLDPNIDFVTSPTSYKARQMGGFSIFNSLTESLAHHNKLWWNENDILTPLAPVPKSDLFYMPKSMEESRHIQLREFANVLCHGSSMWWFDMFAGWFEDKQTMTDIAAMAKIGRKAVLCDRSDTAEIAVVLDDKSICYTECTNTLTVPLITDQLMELGHAGVPFAMVHVDDIAEMRPYKMYLFLNLFYVDDARLKAIHSCIRKPGVTSLFLYAPGIVGNSVAQQNMETLTGIKLAIDTTGGIARVQTSMKTGLPAAEYGMTAVLSPLVYSMDSTTEVLGLIKGGEKHGLVRKNIGKAVSIFSVAPAIPAAVLRSLFKTAGCHVYTDNGEIVYANKSFFAVCGMPEKSIVLNIPTDSVLLELFSDVEYKPGKNSLVLPASPTGVWVFFRGSRQEWDHLQ